MFHGAKFLNTLSKNVTHLISTSKKNKECFKVMVTTSLFLPNQLPMNFSILIISVMSMFSLKNLSFKVLGN